MLLRFPDFRVWGAILRWIVLHPASTSSSLPSFLSPPFSRDQEGSRECLSLGLVEEQKFWEESHSGSMACSGSAVGLPFGVSLLRAQGRAALILLTQADLEKLQPTNHGLFLSSGLSIRYHSS